MADYKLSMNDSKDGKSYKREVKDEEAQALLGHKIGDKVKGDAFGLPGYEFEITGGSDNCGFPLRKDISVPRKRILTVSGVGVKPGRDGMRQRKTVCGNRLDDNTSQVNLKILKYGKDKLGEPGKEQEKEDKPEDKKKEDKPKDKKKEKQPKDKKKEDKPEEKKKEEK